MDLSRSMLHSPAGYSRPSRHSYYYYRGSGGLPPVIGGLGDTPPVIVAGGCGGKGPPTNRKEGVWGRLLPQYKGGLGDLSPNNNTEIINIYKNTRAKEQNIKKTGPFVHKYLEYGAQSC